MNANGYEAKSEPTRVRAWTGTPIASESAFISNFVYSTSISLKMIKCENLQFLDF